jgi:hypothetical protein
MPNSPIRRRRIVRIKAEESHGLLLAGRKIRVAPGEVACLALVARGRADIECDGHRGRRGRGLR